MYDMDMVCCLKGSTASAKMYWHDLQTCIRECFSHLSQIWESICGGNAVNVKLDAHPQPEKVLKPLMFVWHGYWMQFE
jgi:hypothetical protein